MLTLYPNATSCLLFFTLIKSSCLCSSKQESLSAGVASIYSDTTCASESCTAYFLLWSQLQHFSKWEKSVVSDIFCCQQLLKWQGTRGSFAVHASLLSSAELCCMCHFFNIPHRWCFLRFLSSGLIKVLSHVHRTLTCWEENLPRLYSHLSSSSSNRTNQERTVVLLIFGN